MNLVKGHRQSRIINSDLDKPALLAAAIGFRTNPLRSGRLRRPDNDDRLRGLKLFLDHLGKCAVGRQILVEPQREAGGSQPRRKLLRVGKVGPRVREKDVRHRSPVPRRNLSFPPRRWRDCWFEPIADAGDPLQFGDMTKLMLFGFAATAAIAFARPALAQGPSAESLPFTLKQLGPGVYAVIDGPERKALSNAGFVIGDDGVLVIDSLFTPEAAQALVAEIRRVTPKPIRYVVNTHYHADHTGGDQVLRDAGAIIIAHKNVRGWVRTNNIDLFGDRITPELKARVEALSLPDVTTDKDLIIWLGSRKVIVKTVLGHTGGDLVVSVPDAKVLFAGDMLWRKVAPNLIDGSVEEWSATVAEFVSGPDAAGTRFVPGHGDVADAKDVSDFRSYLLELRRLVGEGREVGLKDEALVQAIAPKLRAKYPDWTISDRSIAAEVRYMNDELAGTKKRPAPQDD